VPKPYRMLLVVQDSCSVFLNNEQMHLVLLTGTWDVVRLALLAAFIGSAISDKGLVVW
jgi:hypothetical protein